MWLVDFFGLQFLSLPAVARTKVRCCSRIEQHNPDVTWGAVNFLEKLVFCRFLAGFGEDEGAKN